MSDIDSNGSWGNAVSTFEAQRPDLVSPARSATLTAEGACTTCGEEGGLYRTEQGAEPDTCTSCRGPVR